MPGVVPLTSFENNVIPKLFSIFIFFLLSSKIFAVKIYEIYLDEIL